MPPGVSGPQGCAGLYPQRVEMETEIRDQIRSGYRRRWISRRGRRWGRCRWTSREPRLQGSEPGPQHLVLLTCQPGYLLDRLELLAFDQIEVAQPLLRLGLEHGVDLALDPLRDAGSIVHQARDLVEKAVAGLGHGSAPETAVTSLKNGDAGPGRQALAGCPKCCTAPP